MMYCMTAEQRQAKSSAGQYAAEMGWPNGELYTAESAKDPNTLAGMIVLPVEANMEFEKAWAKYIGAKMAISCTNGTAALHIAISCLGIGPGDEVIVTSYSFIAPSFAVVQAGAIPVFCDVTEDHTIDPDKIEALITPRTKGIVVVHLYGGMADMKGILAVAKKHNLTIIEDCAQCFGGEYNGVKAGVIGDVGCFSFCQSKHFTTGGEGGMVVTNNEDLGWECRSFRDHGYDVKARMVKPPSD